MISELVTDPLSSTLMRMKLRSSAAGAIDAAGTWAFAFPEFEGFKLQMLMKGEAWVSIEGDKTKHRLKAGDCFLMTGGRPCVVSKLPTAKKTMKMETLIKSSKNGVMTVNGGGEFFSIGTLFQFEGHLPRILFSHLPPAIHIPGHLDQAAILRWSLERFRTEFLGDNVGKSLFLNHLTPIMLLQILRIYLASVKKEEEGNWLVALSDPKLSRAISAIHTNYRQNWSLGKLAEVAGMSRSGFALNFKKQVGIPPMDYLAHWRMQIACELLKSGEHKVSSVADAVGYESESAFSVAFNKIIHCRPGFYQKSMS